jgi:iron complex transport system ATP-binding protein
MTPLLEAHNLTCAYGIKPVFTDVSIAARVGEVLALIGPNGAGKTTLLRALARLLRPRAGVVLFDRQPIQRMPTRFVAQQLAFAPQTQNLTWPLTVAQTVALGRAPHRGWFKPFNVADRAIVQRVLERMGLCGMEERLLTELSGGEQRRVILARALAQEPVALLLDEPTAHLDLKYQIELIELARTLAHQDGLAVIMTLHDLNQAAVCADRVALLAGGRLLAAGSVAEALTPDAIQEAYGVPVSITRHPLDDTLLVTPRVG